MKSEGGAKIGGRDEQTAPQGAQVLGAFSRPSGASQRVSPGALFGRTWVPPIRSSDGSSSGLRPAEQLTQRGGHFLLIRLTLHPLLGPKRDGEPRGGLVTPTRVPFQVGAQGLDERRRLRGDLQDNAQDGYRTTRDELVESLQGQVEYLKGVVATRDEEIRRRDHNIIAGLVERVPALEAPRDERDGRETPAAEPEGAEPRPATGGAQEGAQRSWLYRFFFGP